MATTATKTQDKKTDDAARNLDMRINESAQAQKIYATFSQEQVDAIFREASLEVARHRIPLAKKAVAETGMGILEDKVIKNLFASEMIYNKFKNTPTCGIIERDETAGIIKIADPIGVICGIIPTTNPTSTAIFKSLIALKTRNAIVFSPHPRAKDCTIEAVSIIRAAAEKAGAPRGLINWIEEPSIALSQQLMTHEKISLILATGGPGMVKAAYSSGKPALGVGAGNTPVLIDETADIARTVNSVLMSKTFDNGVICASEQAVIVHKKIAADVKKEFLLRGAYFLNKEEKAKVAATLLNPEKGTLNPAIVGQSAFTIAEMAGVKVPESAKVLIGEVTVIDKSEPFAHEKLSPTMAFYTCSSFEEGVDMADKLIELGGLGHTSSLYIDESKKEQIDVFSKAMKTGRILVNTPAAHGAIGDLYNFSLNPSLTLGCGSWGGNSVSENVGVAQLVNVKTVAERRENMLWFRVPPKVYQKFGCLSLAMQELKECKRAFLVTDAPLVSLGYHAKVTAELDKMNIAWEMFSDVQADPTLAVVKTGAEAMRRFQPDVVIALGGGSPMDAAKTMKVMYEDPQASFEGMAQRFMDIEKRTYKFPEGKKKAQMVCIPTTSGTGSEVTPFAVVTDEKTGTKYPLADYYLTPDMAIVDAELVLTMPSGLTAASGIDAVTHALEAIASVMDSDYTRGLALEALRNLFTYLPVSYAKGASDKVAREKVHNAATMAGMAFSNAFLGICHSMAHKLGAAFHIPHGVANALLITQVIRFNAVENPTKIAAFSQYGQPEAIQRYAQVADYLGLKGKTDMDKVEALCNRIEALAKELNIPATIAEAGVREADFLAEVDNLAELAFDDQCTGANPRYPLIKELRQMYLNAFYGQK